MWSTLIHTAPTLPVAIHVIISQACLDKAGGVCEECHSGGEKTAGGAATAVHQAVQAALPCAPLEAVCSKYEYKLSALRGMQAALASVAL